MDNITMLSMHIRQPLNRLIAATLTLSIFGRTFSGKFLNSLYDKGAAMAQGLRQQTCAQQAWTQLPLFSLRVTGGAGKASSQNCSHVSVKLLPQ